MGKREDIIMIRSLSNGLEILIFLNKRNSSSAGELSKKLGIPRATVYRILGTLEEKGFVYKHPDDHRYHIKPKVKALSEGYSEDDQLTTIARPHLLHVTKILRWPIALAVKSGVELILRDNTDKASPLAIEHFSSGYNVPILGNASGPCILANLSLIEQRDILNVLRDTGRLVDLTKQSVEEIIKSLKIIKKQGYSIHKRERNKSYVGYMRISNLTSLSIPIIKKNNNIVGAMTIRYATSALTKEKALKDFIPVMRKAASKIVEQIENENTEQGIIVLN
jgi:IclR family mhp operon transcriptional activator